MKTLEKILESVRYTLIQGDESSLIQDLKIDSRYVQKGDCFIAVKGHVADGHDFIQMAIDAGAQTIICSQAPEEIRPGICYVVTANTKKSLGVIASNFFEKPSGKLKVWGVTGTNGKTTSSVLMFKLFRRLGMKVGLISTIDIRINEEVIPTNLTTPDAITLQRIFARMVDENCDFVFMEVSSHAIDQGRINGIQFDVASFTNISHDHLDYHKDMKEYIRVKKMFFDNLEESAIAIINIDDKNGKIMLQNCLAEKRSFAMRTMADYKGKIIDQSFQGLHMKINETEAYFKIVGSYNGYNLLNVVASAEALGLEMENFLTELSALNAAEGRLEQVSVGKRSAFVDYAHTPDALENVLKTLIEIRSRGEKIITVIGAGGDRDKSKRPKMARTAAVYSDQVILTSDNPRTEDPETIISDMEAGIDSELSTKVLKITNREQAIKTACMLAQENDVILVAGKGHEKYQDINGVKIPFDDKEILKKILKNY